MSSNLIAESFVSAVAVQVDTPDGPSFVQFGESSTQKPQVCINFEILEGDDAGRRIAWFGYFTEGAAQRTVESLRYCGFKGNDLAMAVTQDLDQVVQLQIKHEEYKGKVSAKVAWVNRGGGGGYKLEKQMGKSQLAQFAAMMKGSVGAIPEAPGKKADRTAKPAASTGGGGSQGNSEGPPAGWSENTAPPDDDGIPF